MGKSIYETNAEYIKRKAGKLAKKVAEFSEKQLKKKSVSDESKAKIKAAEEKAFLKERIRLAKENAKQKARRKFPAKKPTNYNNPLIFGVGQPNTPKKSGKKPNPSENNPLIW